jgi:hypothetical protein
LRDQDQRSPSTKPFERTICGVEYFATVIDQEERLRMSSLHDDRV